MYQKRVSTLRLDQEDREEAKGDVLSEVRVNSHGTEYPLIARMSNGNSQAAPQAQRTNAERNKEECEECCVEREDVHRSLGASTCELSGPQQRNALGPECNESQGRYTVAGPLE